MPDVKVCHTFYPKKKSPASVELTGLFYYFFASTM